MLGSIALQRVPKFDTAAGSPSEIPVQNIPLEGLLANNQEEFSGMAWYGDQLVLLPQYPTRMSKVYNGALPTIPRTDLESFLDGKSTNPIKPAKIYLDSGGMEWRIRGFEGYESIVFHADQVYLTIEAWDHFRNLMRSYLVKGQVIQDGSVIKLDALHYVEVPLSIQITNFSNETMLDTGDHLLLFYEANGSRVNFNPVAKAYDYDLQPLPNQAIPNIEYRLTDAAAPDADGSFWVLNTFYPGDFRILPLSDPLAEQYGRGPTHAHSMLVERLVKFNLPTSPEQPVTLADIPPIQLQLASDNMPRNWEGLVELPGRGLLITTDKFPVTLLGFVAFLGEQ
jgi:hypothetical protein